MILTFSKQAFKDRIISGVKVHTIRRDIHNRWKVGNKIHFWIGNPRNTRSKTKPHQFGIGEVSRVETISLLFDNIEDWQTDRIRIGNDIILKTKEELNAFAENEGYDNWYQLKNWFTKNGDKEYFGKIIFWKNFELTANADGSTVY